MVIEFNSKERELIKKVAKDYGYTEDRLKDLYTDIMSRNFLDDIYGIAGENQTSYANNK